MTKLLGPYALSATSETPFYIEWDFTAQPPLGIDIENVSGLLHQVTIGATSYWLSPWTARYFPVTAGAVNAMVKPLGDLSPASADPLRMLATLYQYGDTPPSQEPRSLASMALIAGISGEVTLANGAVVNLATGALVGIQGTPSVAVSNTPGVNVANSPTVGLAAGSTIEISGTTAVTLSGSNTVDIGNTPTVNLTAGSAVDITSGTVVVEQGTASNLNAITVGGIPTSDFGTGANGAATIAANTTLTADMNYTNLTINAGVTLSTGGYMIRCTGTLINNGIIDNSGNGENGGASGSLAGGANGVSVGGGIGWAAGNSPASANIEGGAGGATAYAGGATILPVTSSTALYNGDSISGGASGGAYTNSSDGSGAQSGGGGGVVYIAASTIAGTGTIRSNGGNGAIGPNSAYPQGGGGGGGGVIAILTHNISGQTYTVNGGAPAVRNGGTAYAGKTGQTLVYIG